MTYVMIDRHADSSLKNLILFLLFVDIEPDFALSLLFLYAAILRISSWIV